MSAALSYSSGESVTPLLGDTIGGNFDATVRAFGDREALVDCPTGRRWTYTELAADVDALALGLLELGIAKGDRVGIWAPNCAEWTLTQYATAKIGAILVNINPAYRTRELEFVLNQSGSTLLVAAERLKTSDYAAMIAEVRAALPGLKTVVLLGSPEWQALLDAGRRLDRGALDAIELDTDDPINIQYTSGTTGFPKGATLSHHNILNNGFFVGELCNYTEADRICIPVPFYHCFGMVMGNLVRDQPRRLHGHPRAGLRPGRDAGGRAGRTLHLALRGAHHVHRRAVHPGLRRLRPVQPAHRHHGRLAVPGRGDEAGHRADGHDRGGDLLRHDGNLAGLHPDPRRRLARPPGVHRGPGRAAPRGEGRRPRDGPDRAARHPGRAVHPRLLGDARLLEPAGQDRRGHRRGALDAHRRPRRDGRRRVPGHHRADQGHGDPRRREHLPAGDRGVPLHPPRHPGRPGHRRARREVRRGAHGLGPAARGRAGADRRVAARVLHGEARPLQDPAVRAHRRRVPDDGHRQGAQGRDAGALGRAPRPRRQADGDRR